MAFIFTDLLEVVPDFEECENAFIEYFRTNIDEPALKKYFK